MPTKNEYKDYYDKNNAWILEEGINPHEVLASMYPEYYIKANTVNIEKFKADLASGEKNARELLKNLYSMPERIKPDCTSKVFNSDLMQSIKAKFGHRVIAHGVEEAKGGLYNLLSMSISNKIFAPSIHWGPLVDCLPDISALAHGPYYVIWKTDANERDSGPSYPEFSEVEHVLVPFQEVSEMLIEKIEKLIQDGLMTKESGDIFRHKLISYQDFYELLKKRQSDPYVTNSQSALFSPPSSRREVPDEKSEIDGSSPESVGK